MGDLADFLATHDTNFRKARLPALYADFRSQASLNPDGYHANISAWCHGLSLLASRGLLANHGSTPNILTITTDESLLRALGSRQYGQPMALGTVVEESVSNKDMFPLQTFLQAQQSIYQSSWGNVPWTIMGWTLRQIGITNRTGGDDKLPKGQFVLMENLEAATKSFEDAISDKSSKFDRIFTKTEFYRTFSSSLMDQQQLSSTDIDILLRFMSRDKGIVEYNGKVIRIREPTDHQPGITEEDASIASLKELMAKLKHQTDILNTRIDALDIEAKQAVAKKNRVKALASLKAKKLAESSLSQRYATLNQVEEVAAKIEQASDNVQLISVMKTSTGVLKSLNAQVGGVDKIDTVMDDLRDRISDTDELAAILAESTGAPVDESELDDELAAMEREIKEKQDQKDAAAIKQKLDSLPAVPSEEARPEREKTPTSETGIEALSLGS